MSILIKNESGLLFQKDEVQEGIKNAVTIMDKLTVYEGRGNGKQYFKETTIPIIRAALNKQIKADTDPPGYCPVCGHKIILQSQNYCGYCGQAIRRREIIEK